MNKLNQFFVFFHQNIPSRTSDNEKANKDMPLISDTAFNSSKN